MLALKEKTHNIKDYAPLPEGAPCQLMERELVATPAPYPKHQIPSGNLVEKIRQYTKGSGITMFSPPLFTGDVNGRVVSVKHYVVNYTN